MGSRSAYLWNSFHSADSRRSSATEGWITATYVFPENLGALFFLSHVTALFTILGVKVAVLSRAFLDATAVSVEPEMVGQ